MKMVSQWRMCTENNYDLKNINYVGASAVE